jgi:hypothetical protein
MSLRTALDRLVVLQEAVAISSPISTTVRKAYKYVPNQAEALSQTPLFFNSWTFAEERRAVSLAERMYSVRMQLAVEDGDLDRAADIATALFEQFLADLRLDVTLNGNVTRADVRGNSPTLVGLTYGGQTYVGIDMNLDFSIVEGATYAP